MENGERTYGPAQQLLNRVFAWMTIAVGISGVTALVIAESKSVIMQNPWIFFGLLILQLIIVVVLSSRILSLSYPTAQVLFIGYSILSGATLSLIFAQYTYASIVQVFFIAAGMFGGMAVYGAYTKTDLTQYRSLLTMTLWGLIIAMVVNIFLGSSTLDFITAIIGVLLFSALTAFDIQNIQKLAMYLLGREEDFNKIALIGALQLYLDFINLFLFLLRMSGDRRR